MAKAVYRKRGFWIGDEWFRTYAEAAAAKGVSTGYLFYMVAEGREHEIGSHPRCGVKYARKKLARIDQ